MKVREVMSSPVLTVSEDASYQAIADLLVRHAISGAPVVDEAGTVVGVVSEADLVHRVASDRVASPGPARTRGLAAALFGPHDRIGERKAAGLTARALMTQHLVTCHPDEQVHAAARRMAEAGVKRLPVMEDGALVGIVSRRDVISTFHRSDGELQMAIELLLERCGFGPPEHTIAVAVDEGVVTLRGTVCNDIDEQVVTNLIAASRGVVQVRSELRARAADHV